MEACVSILLGTDEGASATWMWDHPRSTGGPW